MIQEFKKFVMRGNVVDLAVAVVIGAAFTAVVNSVVDDLVNPLLGLAGNQDFSEYVITLRDPEISAAGELTDPGVVLRYGAVLTEIINFLLVAAAVFFLIVKPLNVLAERRARGQVADEETPPPSDEVILLGEIRDLLQQRTP